jgi:hypothetical protein
MNTFVRTNKAMNYLQKISRMTLLTLSIIFSISATSAPIYSNSSDRSSDASSSAPSYSMQPASYQMTNISNYQVSTTLNPAQTVYAPFSDENPSNSGDNGPSKITNRKNGFNQPSDPDPSNQSPLGDTWSLLIFAALGAGVIYLKQRKRSALKA